MFKLQTVRLLTRGVPRMATAPTWVPQASFHAGRVALSDNPTDSEESVHAELHHGHRTPQDLAKETAQKAHADHYGSAAPATESEATAKAQDDDTDPQTLAKQTANKAQKENSS